MKPYYVDERAIEAAAETLCRAGGYPTGPHDVDRDVAREIVTAYLRALPMEEPLRMNTYTIPQGYTKITARRAARRNLIRDSWTFGYDDKVWRRNDDARVYWLATEGVGRREGAET